MPALMEPAIAGAGPFFKPTAYSGHGDQDSGRTPTNIPVSCPSETGRARNADRRARKDFMKLIASEATRWTRIRRQGFHAGRHAPSVGPAYGPELVVACIASR